MNTKKALKHCGLYFIYAEKRAAINSKKLFFIIKLIFYFGKVLL
jgi:hypothetical protein